MTSARQVCEDLLQDALDGGGTRQHHHPRRPDDADAHRALIPALPKRGPRCTPARDAAASVRHAYPHRHGLAAAHGASRATSLRPSPSCSPRAAWPFRPSPGSRGAGQPARVPRLRRRARRGRGWRVRVRRYPGLVPPRRRARRRARLRHGQLGGHGRARRSGRARCSPPGPRSAPELCQLTQPVPPAKLPGCPGEDSCSRFCSRCSFSTRCCSRWSCCFRPARAAGLASLGGGTTDTVLGGRQAVTLLTKATWWCGGIFLVLALVLSLVPRGGGSSALQERLRGHARPRRPSAPLPLGGTRRPPAPGSRRSGAASRARRRPAPARPPRRAGQAPRPPQRRAGATTLRPNRRSDGDRRAG